MSQASSGGISFGGALLILFIGLKLGGVIDWSWWWVLITAWLPLAIAAVIVVGASLAWVVASIYEGVSGRRRRGW